MAHSCACTAHPGATAAKPNQGYTPHDFSSAEPSPPSICCEPIRGRALPHSAFARWLSNHSSPDAELPPCKRGDGRRVASQYRRPDRLCFGEHAGLARIAHHQAGTPKHNRMIPNNPLTTPYRARISAHQPRQIPSCFCAGACLEVPLRTRRPLLRTGNFSQRACRRPQPKA